MQYYHDSTMSPQINFYRYFENFLEELEEA